MNLCIAYKGHDRQYNDSGFTYDESNNIKVVACPFCGISTSNGEVLKVLHACCFMLFKCLTCEKIAFVMKQIEIIAREEVEKLYPEKSITDNTIFYLAKLYKIIAIQHDSIRRFCMAEDMTNNDVIAFYYDLKKFTYENKIDINFQIDKNIANKFLESNKLAKKYNIRYGQWNKDKGLAVRINDYCLSGVPFHGYLVVICEHKNNDNNKYLLIDCDKIVEPKHS